MNRAAAHATRLGLAAAGGTVTYSVSCQSTPVTFTAAIAVPPGLKVDVESGGNQVTFSGNSPGASGTSGTNGSSPGASGGPGQAGHAGGKPTAGKPGTAAGAAQPAEGGALLITSGTVTPRPIQTRTELRPGLSQPGR